VKRQTAGIRSLNANFRRLRAIATRLRWPLLTLAAALVFGTLTFWLGGTQRDPIKALLFTINLVTFNIEPDWVPDSALLRLAVLAVVICGIAAFAGGVANIIEYARDPQLKQMTLASTFSNHVIVCGLGRVGYSVVMELLELGDSVVVVNATAREDFADTLRRAGVPLIIGDARQSETLINAGIKNASSLVACTSDDLTNLDIALDARELQPNIKIVLRMFDQKLAERIRRGFNIKTAFSVSALAAPALAAAATRTKVDYSFKLDGALMNVLSIKIAADSRFTGRSVKAIEDETGCAVIGFDQIGASLRMNPSHDYVVKTGDTLHIVGPLEGIRMLT
jgi:Trk K+ transport system NAD-binding subunit